MPCGKVSEIVTSLPAWYHPTVMRDAEPYTNVHRSTKSFKEQAIVSFVEAVERKLDVHVEYDRRDFPFGRTDLVGPVALADSLLRAGVISRYFPVSKFPDEPQIKLWSVRSSIPDESTTVPEGAGASWKSDIDALTASLAEALERFLWKHTDDYFRNRQVATPNELKRRGLPHIPPERFAAFSPAQRASRPELRLTPDTQLLWIESASLVTGRTTLVPAQTACGLNGYHPGQREALIRQRTSNGLATWPTQEGARLAGALEVIEREAFMIMWLNQFSLPRFTLSALAAQHQSISTVISVCARYRLTPHIVQLATDAPTYAICAVLEDQSGVGPKYTIGLKAHRSLVTAVEKAVLEALRPRIGIRARARTGASAVPTSKGEIGHYDRLEYWSTPAHADKLAFLIRGKETARLSAPWDTDSEAAHLDRIVSWCRDTGLEYVSVPLTHSKKNPTSFHVEIAIIPELQPIHLAERLFMHGGSRWKTVPMKLGLTPRATMFVDEPHPFA